MQENKKIRFSKNWNGKLFNNHYTTIRGFYYDRDTIVDIILNGEYHHSARVVEVLNCKIKDLPEWLMLLDTGIPKPKSQELIMQMTKKTEEDLVQIMVLVKLPQYQDKSQ
jgi:hypothetical protein